MTPGTAPGSGLGSSAGPLSAGYDAALLDLDGVLYLGDEGIGHASAAVAQARSGGMRIAYVTNNASRPPEQVAAHLCRLGIPAVPHDVVTSAAAAARVLREWLGPDAAVLVLGTRALADAVAAAGLRPVRRIEEAGSDGVMGIVQGLDPELDWRALAEASVAIRGGALWVAGNADATYPSPRGPLPGNGAMVAALTAATGARPLVVGKPAPELHDEAVARVGARHPLVVGDRLDSDILGAVAVGADSLLVLTGVTDLRALFGAPVGMRPAFVGPDLRALGLPHPPVTVRGEEAHCGDVVVTTTQTIFLNGSIPADSTADPGGVAAVRAACALAWSRRDASG